MKMMEKLKFTGVALAILILLSASPGAGLFSAGAVTAAPDDELCQECQLYAPEPQDEYPIMRPSREERLRWIEGYNRAPKAHISDKISRELDRSPEGSQSLLDHLQYTPSERSQGSCGNCWAWAGTGVMEIALDVQDSVKDRLSMQYLNSNYNGGSGSNWACCGGWLEDVADFYTSKGMAIPWSNTNASWQDSGRTCGSGSTSVPAVNISTTPNYPITSITDQTISTQGVGQSTAITNIKSVLNQNKAVWFGFFMPTAADWTNFSTFWDDQSENIIWNPDFSCGGTWEDPGGGGHAVLCVGYNDEDGTANDYWVMLNSWGTAGDGRPNGLFHLAMDMDYDCAHYDGGWWYSFYWQTLDITYDVEPTVTNAGGATDITSTTARLNGEVTDTGGENPTVHIYWGTTDGGTTTGSWDNDVNLGTKGTGTFYTDISGLDTGTTTYYYRCYATNSGGTVWADSTNSFRYRTTLDRQVGASSDDSRVWDSIGSGSWDTTYTTFLVGHMTAEKYKGRSCARFTNITIPQGATITEAHLTLRADRSLSNTTVNSKLACEAADDAAAFSTYANFTARPRTATVDWNNIPAWTADTEYNSPDIKSCIQAVTNRAGWQSGNDIVVFWEDTGDLSSKNTNTFRCAYSYDKNATYAPNLHIEYSGEAPIVAPTVTNSTGATDVTSTSARLNGEVTSTGGENPTVHIYWGTTDGGTTTGSWDNDVNLGTKGTGTFYTDISGLDTGTTTYYYRCYATNSGGTAWADSTNSFRYRTTLDRQVGASSDDSRVWDSIGSGSWDTTYTTFLVGHMTAEKYKGRSCARFTNITIPQGATITEAHLTLRADRSLSNTTVNSKLACEAADDAAAFSTYANFTARPRTATVDWNNIPTWTTDTEYNSPDIKSCIQAVINRAGWQSGNDIVVFWEDTGDLSSKNTNTFRCAYSYDKNATYAPNLHIEYSGEAPEPPDAPTPVSPGTAITFKWNSSSGATKYHLQVNTLANFSGTYMFNAELGDVTSQEVTGLSIGTTYYWHVKAGNAAGWSDWSSPTRSVLAN